MIGCYPVGTFPVGTRPVWVVPLTPAQLSARLRRSVVARLVAQEPFVRLADSPAFPRQP